MFFSIIGVIVVWLIASFVTNFLFYSNVPEHLRGNDSSAKTVHIIINIIAALVLLKVIFG